MLDAMMNRISHISHPPLLFINPSFGGEALKRGYLTLFILFPECEPCFPASCWLSPALFCLNPEILHAFSCIFSRSHSSCLSGPSKCRPLSYSHIDLVAFRSPTLGQTALFISVLDKARRANKSFSSREMALSSPLLQSPYPPNSQHQKTDDNEQTQLIESYIGFGRHVGRGDEIDFLSGNPFLFYDKPA